MIEKWETSLTRWVNAGVVDEPTAARVRAFETEHADSERLRWPTMLALAFGALALAAGVLLFVAAHWDDLSPSVRFGLVTGLVASFHLGGAFTEKRFPAMAMALHAVGTVALGAGIYLTGQIFNLAEHWPGGLMLWAIGAALAWALLRSWPQAALTAILAPAWLIGEWTDFIEYHQTFRANQIVPAGIVLLALVYFTSGDRNGKVRRALVWIGGIAILPAMLALWFASTETWAYNVAGPLPRSVMMLGWTGAVGVPLAVAFALRRAAAWPIVLAAVWVAVAVNLGAVRGELAMYPWWALGATALAAWGVAEASSERVNVATAIFAVTLIAFYFSQIMDKIGRSASLMGLGVLFLAGGWVIEQTRRRLVARARGAQL